MSIDELINLAMQEEYGKTQHSGGWEELHIPTLKHGIELAITEAYKKGRRHNITRQQLDDRIADLQAKLKGDE